MKKLQDNKNTKIFLKPNQLSRSIALIALMCAGNQAVADVANKKIGDLEIYQSAKGGNTNLVMMLDTSGSMGISSLVLPKNNSFGSPGDVDQSICDSVVKDTVKQWTYNWRDNRGSTIPVIGDETRKVANLSQGKTTFYHVAKVGGQDVSFYLRGCRRNDANAPTVEMYDRLSRLKLALIELLAAPEEKGIKNNVVIGLGHYSARANPNSKDALKVENTEINLVDGHSGTILVPAAKLDDAQRLKLAKAIAAFQSVDTTTDETGNTVGQDNVKFNTELAAYSVSRLSPVSAKPLNIYRAAGGTPTVHAYAEAGAYMMGTTTGGVNPNMKIKWLYDSTNIVYNPKDNVMTYWVCVYTDPSRTTKAFGGAVPIKQCHNQEGDSKLTSKFLTYTSGGAILNVGNGPNQYNQLWKQDANKRWVKVERAEADKVVGVIPNNTSYRAEDYIWDIVKKIPVGWRLGGSMKVANEPMDIEPVSGGIWDAHNEFGYIRSNDPMRTLVTYRTNPFTYEGDTGQKVCVSGDGFDYEFINDGSGFKCRATTDGYPTAQQCQDGYYTNCYDTQERRIVNSFWGPIWSVVNVKRGRHRKHPSLQTVEVDNMYGGMRYSDPASMNSAKTKYNQVANGGVCSSNGIYFLTDGAPNSTKDNMAQTILNHSLTSSHAINTKPQGLTSPALLSGMFSGETGGWEYIGEYAKKLNDPTKNPSGISIKTAVAGFGSSFAGLTKRADGTYDCNTSGANQDAKNACKWGQKGEGYGEGGFFYAQTTKDIKDSIDVFIKSLNNNIPASPSGTIAIPKDPLSINNIQPYAYLPMVQSEPSQAFATWRGNLKKYHTLDGTLYGQNRQRLYRKDPSATTENQDYPFAFNENAADIWQKSAGNSGDINVGGSYSQIPANNRQVYVEVVETLSNNTVSKKLQLVRPKNLADLQALKGYTLKQKAYLMNYLGYDVPIKDYANDQELLKAVSAINSPKSTPNLGGVLHSLPVLATYEGQIDTMTGNIVSDESKRDDNIIYGSMEGGLHMVGAKDGEEKFTFIPRAMFENEKQLSAMASPNAVIAEVGSPAFGVDAPWVVNAEYKINGQKMQLKTSTDNEVDASGKVIQNSGGKGMYAYGGLRMGGVGIYGLNITNKASPKLAFSINDKTQGFERMGQIWSKPLAVKIKQGQKYQDVLIFGGGYDMCYENPNFKLNDPNNTDTACKNKAQVQGNAIYMVNATDGKLIKSWSTNDNSNMNHSVVAEINGLDRNNDGAVDHLYAADLGGQIFRVDLNSSNLTGSKIVRVFDANKDIKHSSHINFRFYERPIVSFYNRNGGRFAVINVASGDRSSPLSKNRGTDTSETTDANRIYGIFDRDIAKSNILAVTNYQSKDLDNSSLQRLDTKKIASGNDDFRKNLIGDMQTKKQGWYYDMIRFAGNIDVPHLKAVGPGMVTGGIYYASIYSPEYQYSKGGSCSAGIEGGTERQMYCLPWGICANPNTGALTAGNDKNPRSPFKSKNGTLGFIKAGPGIHELAMTTITGTENKSTPFRAIISHQTIDEQIKNPSNYQSQSGAVTGTNGGFQDSAAKNQINNGAGSDILTVRDHLTDTYTMRFQRWYDLQDAENN